MLCSLHRFGSPSRSSTKLLSSPAIKTFQSPLAENSSAAALPDVREESQSVLAKANAGGEEQQPAIKKKMVVVDGEGGLSGGLISISA